MAVFIVKIDSYPMRKVRSGEAVRLLHSITPLPEWPEVMLEYPFDIESRKPRTLWKRSVTLNH